MHEIWLSKMVWFLSLCLAGTSLTLKAAINALHSASSRWYQIGVQLDVPTHLLKNIQQQHHDPIDCLTELLDNWMKNATDPPPSWRALIDALRAPIVGEKRLAEELEEKYCSQKEQGKCSKSKYCAPVKSEPNSTANMEKRWLYDLGVTALFLDLKFLRRTDCYKTIL